MPGFLRLGLGRRPQTLTCHAGASLAALAKAAEMSSRGNHDSSLLLSQAAKAEGVPCSPAQLYFLALQQVSSPLATAPCKRLVSISCDISGRAVPCS